MAPMHLHSRYHPSTHPDEVLASAQIDGCDRIYVQPLHFKGPHFTTKVILFLHQRDSYAAMKGFWESSEWNNTTCTSFVWIWIMGMCVQHSLRWVYVCSEAKGIQKLVPVHGWATSQEDSQGAHSFFFCNQVPLLLHGLLLRYQRYANMLFPLKLCAIVLQ